MDDVRHKLPAKPSRFIDCLRLHIREKGLAYRTEQTYVHWIKKFIFFHDKRHLKDMGVAELEVFLSHISIERHCLISTQRIALNALVYFYKRYGARYRLGTVAQFSFVRQGVMSIAFGVGKLFGTACAMLNHITLAGIGRATPYACFVTMQRSSCAGES